MSALDNIDSIRTVDKGGMVEVLLGFPSRVEKALEMKLPDLKLGGDTPVSIAVVGLGGSAIGGDLAAVAAAAQAQAPVLTVRSATLPKWINHSTLVIAVSYSGNTQETLHALREARERGCMAVAVSAGGTLQDEALQRGVVHVCVSAYPQPRLAVGDLTVALLKIIGQALGIRFDSLPLLPETLHALCDAVRPQIPTAQNQAKLLAYKLLDRIPVIAGGGMYAPVARRWKTQINENAKLTCVMEELPELLHNTIEGLDAPARVKDDSIWITLETPRDGRPAEYVERLAGLLNEKEVRHERVVPSVTDSLLAQWWALYLGDWVSYYLAVLNGVDPMPVPTIQAFKEKK